jgi:hypothetical protein
MVTSIGHGETAAQMAALLEEVRALIEPFSNLCLQLQLLFGPDSILANNALRKLGRALS